MKKITIFFLLSYLISYSQNNYLNEIKVLEQFTKFEGQPLSKKFSNIKSLKVVYSLSSKKIYFINSNKFKYHYEFCIDVLDKDYDLWKFNLVNYSSYDERDFLLANLNHIEKSDDWIIELAPTDKMNINHIHFLFKVIKENVFFSDKLKFYASTPRLIKLNQEEKLKIPVIYSDFIFKNITEQSIETGEAVGILKKYDVINKKEFFPKENEIILLNTTPEIIPNVKGIIVTELQTPLSHLVLLAKNRNIPLYVNTQAWNNEKINQLNGKKVLFQVKEESFNINETKKEIKATKKRNTIFLKKDLSVKKLVDLNNKAPKNGQNFIGTKAQNLAYLNEISKEMNEFKTPEYMYAIPFYFYEEHIKKYKLQSKIDSLNYISKDSINQINKQLKIIRNSIKNTIVDKELISSIEIILKNQQDFKNFKFRSSTNVEDLDGFNGAGLYDSKSVKLEDSQKTIEKAIQGVWASLWNDRAYFERELFQINHQSCSVGILIQRSFQDEIANGVLISKNLYREYNGITVNVQKGEESVVEPEKDVVCDEFYVYNFDNQDNNLSIDYRSTSSLNNNIPILNEKEIALLFEISPKIEKKLNQLWRKNNTKHKYKPIDIEFKIMGDNRQLYIKQARIYND